MTLRMLQHRPDPQQEITLEPSQICTADLYDAFHPRVSVCTLQFRSFGRHVGFSGRIETLRSFEDHTPVLKALSEPGEGHVLVVDGGGSLRVGVMGDRLAEIAACNGWSGAVINGAIRDSVGIAGLAIGVKALGTTARRNWQATLGERGQILSFGDVDFVPGHWIYADQDAVIVSAEPLNLPLSSGASC